MYQDANGVKHEGHAGRRRNCVYVHEKASPVLISHEVIELIVRQLHPEIADRLSDALHDLEDVRVVFLIDGHEHGSSAVDPGQVETVFIVELDIGDIFEKNDLLSVGVDDDIPYLIEGQV